MYTRFSGICPNATKAINVAIGGSANFPTLIQFMFKFFDSAKNMAWPKRVGKSIINPNEFSPLKPSTKLELWKTKSWSKKQMLAIKKLKLIKKEVQ